MHDHDTPMQGDETAMWARDATTHGTDSRTHHHEATGDRFTEFQG